MVSYPNVEKVVYAPKNPTPSNSHNDWLIEWFKNKCLITPNRKEPLTFIKKVPSGREVVFLFDMKLPKAYRVIAPIPPPSMTKIKRLILLSVLEVELRIGTLNRIEKSRFLCLRIHKEN